MSYALLLVSSLDSAWGDLLRRAVDRWATVQVVVEELAAEALAVGRYDLVVIDAGAVADAAALTAYLRVGNPTLRILIATASPTWERARAALKAGAVDYMDKTLDEVALRASVRAVLGMAMDQ